MARSGLCLAVASTLWLSGFLSLDAASEPPEPYDIGKTEKVEVRLVTVDVLVLDEKDRTVPGLTAGDFELEVDGHVVPVDTLDATCPAGAAEDPRAARPGARQATPIDSEAPRRIVVVLDYLHLPYLICPDLPPDTPCLAHTRALETLRRFIRERPQGNEEIMVAVLDGGLRIEQTFTPDRAQVLRTLERVEYDVTLWNGHFEHITERPFFGGLEALLEILDAVPGTKAVVLFSGGDEPGPIYDGEFRSLSTLASNARAAIYPVDCEGLQARGFGAGGGLARLAVDTGGRLTRNTNDLTLGYARAQRDLGCRYTIGFYDRHVEEDRRHEVRVKVRRHGLHIVHPSAYVVRSRQKKQESLVRTAYLVPDMFEGGVVRAHVFAIRPRSKRVWDCVLAVDFPVRLGAASEAATRWEFGAVLRRGSSLAHKFSRRLSITPKGTAPSSRQVSFMDRADLKPGSYTLTAVMTAPDAVRPFTTKVRIVVPPIPKRDLFFVGPLLGRRAEDDIVVYGGQTHGDSVDDRLGTAASFAPLLVQQVEASRPLLALTQVCRVKAGGKHEEKAIVRAIKSEDGAPVGALPPVPLELEGTGDVRCQTLLDVLPVSSLRPGRYHFELALEPDEGHESQRSGLHFVLSPAADATVLPAVSTAQPSSSHGP